MPIGPVSEVYQSSHPRQLVDVPVNDHYEAWGYSLAREVDAEGQDVPGWGNTVVFRIHDMTEPVYVTKPTHTSAFEVAVLAGEVQVVKALASGAVANDKLQTGDRTVIKPGQAYFYVNVGEGDALLHDTARPRFEPGDDVELITSFFESFKSPLYIRAKTARSEAGSYCIAQTLKSEPKLVQLPNLFFDLLARAMTER